MLEEFLRAAEDSSGAEDLVELSGQVLWTFALSGLDLADQASTGPYLSAEVCLCQPTFQPPVAQFRTEPVSY